MWRGWFWTRRAGLWHGCPLYVAWVVLDEARDYFRTHWVPSRKAHLIRPADTFSPSDAEKADPMGEGLAAELAQRAEGVFANHPMWQRRFQSAAGREHLLAVMRHWLAGVLAKEQPALFRDLPDSYKVGAPLPPQPLFRPKKIRKRNPPARPFKHFVHGCELLAA
ncbi:MAG TPA: hypothetical protein VGH42_10730 [Verrucomicrobiae bacterium]